MKFNMLIASAALFTAVSAQAQTNVTIYGTVDAAAVYQSNSQSKNVSGIASGGLTPSRIGFKGTEDLGNGTSAFFTLEQGFEVDNNSTLTNRQSFVGLKNQSYGSLSLGRQYSPGYVASADYDAIAASPFSAGQILSAVGGFTAAVNEGGRWNNTVSYVAPVFHGLQASGMYRFGEQVNQAGVSSNLDLEGYGLGLKYVRGDFATSYVFQHTQSSANGQGATGQGSQNEHFVGASYDFKVAKVLGSVQLADWDNNGAGSYTSLYTVGVVAPVVTRTTVHANASFLDVNGGTSATGSASSTSVAAVYALSKRTNLYALVNYTDFSDKLSVSTYRGTVTPSNAFTSVTADGTTVAAGINHTF